MEALLFPSLLFLSLSQDSFCAGCPAGDYRCQVVPGGLTQQAWGAAGSHSSAFLNQPPSF